MSPPIAILAVPSSPVGARIAERLSSSACLLSLDAPLDGEAVTIGPKVVRWQGVDLLETEAIFVERPAFPWPQNQRFEADDIFDRRVSSSAGAEREARSLALSALLLAADRVPVINPPSCAHLAASPAIALDRLQRAGGDVHPWHIGVRAERSGEEELVLDVAGRDRGHEPSAPEPGDPALCLAPFDGEVFTLLVVGDRVADAVRHPDPPAWIAAPAGESLDPEQLPAALEESAVQAARTLELPLAAVALRRRGEHASILAVEAGPDLATWEGRARGRASAALAAHLEHLVRSFQTA